MYTVHLFNDGTMVTAAKHELVKGMEDDEFNKMLPTTSNIDLSSPISNNSNINLSTTTAVPQPLVPATITSPPPPPQQCNTSESITDNQLSNSTFEDDLDANTIEALFNEIFNNTPQKSERFKTIPNDDIDNFIFQNENENTRRKTLSHIKLLRQFLSEEGEFREIQNIPPMELDNYLCKFAISVRQKNGNEYEPSYLRGMFGSFERYLRRHHYSVSLIKGHEFSRSKEVLKCKQKNLKKQGKGNLPNRADAVSDEEINILFEKGCLGTSSPNALLNNMWYLNTLHFGIRGGGEEHRALCWGDITLKHDNELDLNFLEYNERQTKTRTGEDLRNTRESKPRMYEIPSSEHCPVKMYNAYKSKRPADFNEADKPFYLAAATNVNAPDDKQQWFVRCPVGRNKLNNIMKSMVKEAGVEIHGKRLTNTSVRKHLCQKLMDNNVPDNHAIHITGHKNPGSLNNYRYIIQSSNHHNIHREDFKSRTKLAESETIAI